MTNGAEDETPGSAGRGMIVDNNLSEEKCEEMAQELEAEIREKRRTEWIPE